MLGALEPLGVQAALGAWDELAKQEDAKHRSLRLAIEKARYEVERARRQYDAVDPENRLVAEELEHRWEQALGEVKRLEARLAETERTGAAAPTEEERRRLLELGADLRTLWDHPSASSALKKRILRTVLEEIVADVKEGPPRIELRLHWKGGVHTKLLVGRNSKGHHGKATKRAVVELMAELAKVCDDAQIARVLNRLGYRTGAENAWTESRVRSLRNYHAVPVCPPRSERAWYTLAEAAGELGLSTTATRRLIRDGVLVGQQVVMHAPWVIARDALATPGVRAAAEAVRSGRPRPRTDAGQIEIPGISTT